MQTRRIEGSDSPTCAVLVLSCHAYRDLWTPFFTLFKRYWPDCNPPVFLGTDSGTPNLDWVKTLNSGQEAWSGRLSVFLKALNTDYVLLLLEDFFLDRPVSIAQVESELKLLHSLDGVTMRLFPNPPADYFRQGVGVIHSRAAYRVSLQAGIWNRSRLLQLLEDDESPWEFEWRGTQRSRQFHNGFYCVKEPVIHYRHVVERGEWFRAAARRYSPQNIGCNFQARPIMSTSKAIKKKLSNAARRIANATHSRWLCLTYPENMTDAG